MHEKMTWVYFKLGWNAANYDIIHKWAIPLKKGLVSLPYLQYVAALQFAVHALILGGQTSQQSEPEVKRRGFNARLTLTVVSRGTLIFLPFVTLCIQVGLLQSQLGLLQTCNTPAENKPQPPHLLKDYWHSCFSHCTNSNVCHTSIIMDFANL